MFVKLVLEFLDLWTVTASNGRQHLELIINDGKVREITLNLLSGHFFIVSFCCLILLI